MSRYGVSYLLNRRVRTFDVVTPNRLRLVNRLYKVIMNLHLVYDIDGNWEMRFDWFRHGWSYYNDMAIFYDHNIKRLYIDKTKIKVYSIKHGNYKIIKLYDDELQICVNPLYSFFVSKTEDSIYLTHKRYWIPDEEKISEYDGVYRDLFETYNYLMSFAVDKGLSC
jgi:hypothetical protein